MNIAPLVSHAKEHGIVYLVDEPMKNHTSFRIGGPAGVVIYPENDGQCAGILTLCRRHGIPLFILGKGSNLLVGDGGISGAVLSTEKLSGLLADSENIVAKAGASLRDAADLAMRSGLAGLEFAYGIPGSVGGAVYMNAGAYGGETAKVASVTRYIRQDGRLCEAKGPEHDFGYRKSLFIRHGYFITETVFALKRGDSARIAAKMEKEWNIRKEKQPLEYPSAGSVFKRPPGHFAGKLIRDCGLAGYAVGGAAVSEKHCGFIVNRGGATARDVLRLIEHIQKTVKAAYGVLLECEIKRAGIF